MKRMYSKPQTQEEKLLTNPELHQMVDVSNGFHNDLNAAPSRKS